MKKKSLVVKKTIHKSLLKHLKDKKVKKVYSEFCKYLNLNIDKKNSRIAAAISGGPDSLSLAFLLKCYLLANKIEGNFFIVNHNLRKNSYREAENVKKLLKKIDISCKILFWRGNKPISNIQSIARNTRYNLLKKACKKNKINHLLIGHHLNDLYENFFIRLLRGSGLKGLASFGEKVKDKDNFFILRPLIKFKKDKLVYISNLVFNYFIKDPSNENPNFMRSRIRKLLFELKKEGLNEKKLNLTIKNLQIANQAIDFYVKQNIKNNARFNKQKNIYILNKNFFNEALEVSFRSFSIILSEIGGKYYSPRGVKILNSIFKILKKNEPKVNKFTLGGCFIEKVNETVFITKEK